MLKKILLSSCLFTAALYAENVKSPQQIQQEINQAQHDFEIAQDMFIPWYTGPLITGSANNVAPGHVNLQGYFYSTINYAQFNGHRKSVNVPNTYVLNPLLLFQAGLTSWLDVTLIPQWFFKWKQGHYADNVGDFPIQFGLQLFNETPYAPSFRAIIGESFPTGKYQHLSSHKGGIDATGSGNYSTIIGLNISKIFWWLPLHPVAVRLATSYSVPNCRVRVQGFNAYGGGFHTDGRVRVGNTISSDLGVEVSLTQKWVFATDVAYTYSSRTTFSGRNGTLAPGVPATNGGPSSDQLSISPAIEYNVSKTGGFIGGIWVPITGRNSANFVSLVLSYTQYF